MPWLAGLRVGVGVGVGVGWAAGSGRPWSIALDAAKMAIRATPTAAATVASVRRLGGDLDGSGTGARAGTGSGRPAFGRPASGRPVSASGTTETVAFSRL